MKAKSLKQTLVLSMLVGIFGSGCAESHKFDLSGDPDNGPAVLTLAADLSQVLRASDGERVDTLLFGPCARRGLEGEYPDACYLRVWTTAFYESLKAMGGWDPFLSAAALRTPGAMATFVSAASNLEPGGCLQLVARKFQLPPSTFDDPNLHYGYPWIWRAVASSDQHCHASTGFGIERIEYTAPDGTTRKWLATRVDDLVPLSWRLDTDLCEAGVHRFEIRFTEDVESPIIDSRWNDIFDLDEFNATLVDHDARTAVIEIVGTGSSDVETHAVLDLSDVYGASGRFQGTVPSNRSDRDIDLGGCGPVVIVE